MRHPVTKTKVENYKERHSISFSDLCMHMASVHKTVCSCVYNHTYTGVGSTYNEAGYRKFRNPEFKRMQYENHKFKARLGNTIRLYLKIRK